MKILQIVPYFYPAWAYGGPAKLVYDTSVFFATHGHQVIVYTSDAYDQHHRLPSHQQVHQANLIVHYFRNFHNHLAYRYNIFFTPGMYIQALSQIRNVDVVHIHDFYTPQNAWLAWLAWIFKKPFVISVHGCLEEKRVAQRSAFKKIFLQLFGKWMLAHATTLIATSKNEVAAYRQFGVPKKNIYELGHGVNPDEFATTLSKAASRKALDLPNQKTIFTFLGRIHRIKGLDLLVKAIAMVSNPNYHFVIAGSDDGYASTLHQLINHHQLGHRVTLLGTSFGETKARLFKATDVFVYPSYSEGFSLGILEALAAGLPLIITTGCHFEQVATQQAGMIVEPTSKALATAIQRLGDSPTTRQQMAKQARLLIDRSYSMSAIGNNLLALYQAAGLKPS